MKKFIQIHSEIAIEVYPDLSAIETTNVDRAVYHLERRGVKFDYSTATYDDKGAMKFIYLADEINGFAYHLVK